MKPWNKLKRSILISFILMFVFAQILPAQQVKAAEKTGSITLTCEDNSGVTFKLYLVAKQDKHDGYELVEPFDEYSVDLYQKSAAQTLKDYVERDDIEPLRQDETDGDGVIVFDSLEEGAYLILAESFPYMGVDNKPMYFDSLPIFMTVPDNEEGVLTWDRSIKAKGNPTHTATVKQDYFVQKIWEDNKNKDKKRPKSITVQLLLDGKVIKEQELNEKNNWQYTWKDLDPGKYSIMEKGVPSGYKVSKDPNAGVNKTVITNRYTSTSKGNKKYSGGGSGGSSGGSGGSSSKLPQTGQLWWPIGIMLCAGLLCLIIGIRVGRKKED